MSNETGLFVPTIEIAADDAAFSILAAEMFIKALESAQNPVVTLPTGNTPLGVYQALVDHHAHRRDLWDNLRFLALDEYAGLGPDNEKLFSGWLSRVFLDRVGVPSANRILFRSDAADPAQEIARIEDWLKANGPIDMAVLGLGANGHLAFNEPGTSFHQPTHFLSLTPESIRANAAYWGSEADVPLTAYTLGLGTLLQSKEIILLVNGTGKAGILAQTLTGPVTPDVPATALRTRAGVKILADRVAAAQLNLIK